MNKELRIPKAILLWIIGIVLVIAIVFMIEMENHQDAVSITAFRLLLPFLVPYFLMLFEKPMIAGFVLVLEGLIIISIGLGWIHYYTFPLFMLREFLPFAVILANFFSILGMYVLIISWKFSNSKDKSVDEARGPDSGQLSVEGDE